MYGQDLEIQLPATSKRHIACDELGHSIVGPKSYSVSTELVFQRFDRPRSVEPEPPGSAPFVLVATPATENTMSGPTRSVATLEHVSEYRAPGEMARRKWVTPEEASRLRKAQGDQIVVHVFVHSSVLSRAARHTLTVNAATTVRGLEQVRNEDTVP